VTASISQADSLYLAAVAACQSGQLEQGIALVRQAIAHDDRQARSHKLLGMALSRLGRDEEALASFDRAIAVGPTTAELFGARADALAALGHLEEALASYDRAVADGKGSVDDWCNRGNVLTDLNRCAEAAESFGRSIALAPDFAAAHYNRGTALGRLRQYEQAIADFDNAIALNPDYMEAHNNRANALDESGRTEEALASVDRALAIDSSYRDALVTRSVILRKLGRAAEALVTCDRALSIEPDNPDALTVRGDILIGLERFDDAIAAFDKLIALDPGNVAAPWNKSLLCLGLGRFQEGWALYRHRWGGAKGLDPRPYPQPAWDGGRLDGPLLVWGEQGLGDEILHAGILPEVMARTSPIVFEAEPRLVPLFRRSFPTIKVIELRPELYEGPVAAQVPLGELGRFFRDGWQSFPKRERGYLVADEARATALRERLTHGGRAVIGLSWISKAPTGGEAKSARLADFEVLLRRPGYRFVDLQYGDTRTEREGVERDFGAEVEHLADIDNTNDLDGLAALTSACDAVVTVSNTTAHLAGALGRPTWVMVPYGQARIWYWFRDKDRSPWYPRVRVLRQARAQPWSDLIEVIAGEVAAPA
jgi:tetratricopeptide (TPR) repeat protein